MALGVTVLAEVTGKSILGHGLATQLRPRKYYTVSRETTDALIGDIHELVNFFVIEAQRILFAENVAASTAVSRLTTPVQPVIPCANRKPHRLQLVLSSRTFWLRLFLTGALP